jgi:hypothetical protein
VLERLPERGHDRKALRMNDVTYRVRFDDEDAPRTREFADETTAHWWASRNRPGRDYVVLPKSEGLLALLRRRRTQPSSRV